MSKSVIPKRQEKQSHEPDPDRYLQCRAGHWHYYRRVPKTAKAVDKRVFVRTALNTKSQEIARVRRDAHERADDLYWSGLSSNRDVERHTKLYEAAINRARLMGFVYMEADQIAATAPLPDILQRVAKAKQASASETAALLGGVSKPKLLVSEAMEFYIDTLGKDEIRGHSPAQIKSWKKVKWRASANYIKVSGDRPLLEVSRADAQSFYDWWSKRIDRREVGPSAANRDLGNMRKLFRRFTEWHDLDVPNPFDGLNFSEKKSRKKKRPPFSVDWIKTRFLSPGPLQQLNLEARIIFLTLIETGARPSELCNLSPDRIRLSHDVPHLAFEEEDGRVLKSESSARLVPLVGVALAAMQMAPGGFPRYRDKETLLSNTLMKFLRTNDLLETPDHKVYSLRHAFEKRMLEAGLTDDFRRMMMGHVIERPEYGDGGALEWRRDQLLKIALPFDPSII